MTNTTPDHVEELKTLSRVSQPNPHFQLPEVSDELRAERSGAAKQISTDEVVGLVCDLVEPSATEFLTWVLLAQHVAENQRFNQDVAVELVPLQVAYQNTASVIEEYHDAEDQHRLENYPERRIYYATKAADKIQTDFLAAIGYKAPEGFEENVIPVATTFHLSAVDMARLLDMARDRNGGIDKKMLYDLLAQETPYTDELTMTPVVHESVGEVRKGMQRYCGGGVNREQISKGLGLAETVLANATKDVLVPTNQATEVINTMVALVRILAEKEDNFVVLQHAQGMVFESKATVIKSIRAVQDALIEGKGKWNPKIEFQDANRVLEYLRATVAVNKSLKDLGARMNEQVESYATEADLTGDDRTEHIVRIVTAPQNRKYFDVVYFTDQAVQEKWERVVSQFDHLGDTRDAVTRKVVELAKATLSPTV